MVETMEEARAEGLMNASLDNSLSSVELARNSKGYTWKVKAYAKDINEAKAQVEGINADFEAKYGKC